MNLGPLDERVITLFDSGGAVAVAIVVAVAAGSLHALAPGHGKSLTAAYLIGRGGRSRDAAALGLVVAAMHTVSVGVLAVGWYLVVDVVAVELGRVTAVLQLVAALLAVGLGLGMLARRRHHPHNPHDHNGHHTRGRPDPGMVPWSRPGLIALGLSGGLVPSPSAFLVLISGLLAGRLSVALVLVASFAIGMAATLAGVGVVALRGLDLIAAVVARRPGLGRAARAMPVAAAVGVLVSGSVLAARAADVLVGG